MLRHGCVQIWLSCLALVSGCGPQDKALTSGEEPVVTGDAAAPLPDAAADAEVRFEDAATGALAADPECDLNGVWIVKQQTVNVALGLPQTANNWYFFELRQEGEDVRVVEHFDCGIEVLGTVRVQLKPATVEALLSHNLQAGRRALMKKSSDGSCSLEFDRFWSVRGADEARFVPDDRASLDSPATLAKQKPLPSKDRPDGAEDWDGDGQLGIAWYITGIASGERHSMQRDYTEWFSDAEFRIAPARSWTSDFVIRSTIGSEEVVFFASSPTLAGAGTPDGNAKHRVTFHFLGRDRNTPEARNILKPKPLDTCFAIRDAMPAAEL